MQSRKVYFVALAVLLFACVTSASAQTVQTTLMPTPGSGILSEDVSYWWYNTATGLVETTFTTDPEFSLAWLDERRDVLRIKVQQTVYDRDTTSQILEENGDEVPENGGYLYAYSVTNLGWIEGIGTGGVKSFGVNWGTVQPLLVTIDHIQTNSYWTPTQYQGNPHGPMWLWQPSTQSLPGIRIGSTVGGFWAVAPTGNDMIVDAAVGNSTDPQNIIYTIGKTTGPDPTTPEPSSVLVLGAGVAGLVVHMRRRRG